MLKTSKSELDLRGSYDTIKCSGRDNFDHDYEGGIRNLISKQFSKPGSFDPGGGVIVYDF